MFQGTSCKAETGQGNLQNTQSKEERTAIASVLGGKVKELEETTSF